VEGGKRTAGVAPLASIVEIERQGVRVGMPQDKTWEGTICHRRLL